MSPQADVFAGGEVPGNARHFMPEKSCLAGENTSEKMAVAGPGDEVVAGEGRKDY